MEINQSCTDGEVMSRQKNQRTLGGTHRAKPQFKDDISNEISIVIETLARLSFTRALLFVISVSVKWRRKLSVSEIKIQIQNERCPIS